MADNFSGPTNVISRMAIVVVRGVAHNFIILRGNDEQPEASFTSSSST